MMGSIATLEFAKVLKQEARVALDRNWPNAICPCGRTVKSRHALAPLDGGPLMHIGLHDTALPAVLNGPAFVVVALCEGGHLMVNLSGGVDALRNTPADPPP